MYVFDACVSSYSPVVVLVNALRAFEAARAGSGYTQEAHYRTDSGYTQEAHYRSPGAEASTAALGAFVFVLCAGLPVCSCRCSRVADGLFLAVGALRTVRPASAQSHCHRQRKMPPCPHPVLLCFEFYALCRYFPTRRWMSLVAAASPPLVVLGRSAISRLRTYCMLCAD